MVTEVECLDFNQGFASMQRLSLLLTVLALLALSLFAQTSSEILGLVTDESGAVIASAKLVAKNIDTGLTHTGASGESG